jgi:hypothetical protein
MPQKTNLNVDPYFDDFDPSKNFYKVLFRPGYSIQSRELTSLQSILQNQIESYGKFQFKQGELVVPGEVGLNNNLDYVKLSSVSEVAVNVDGNIVYQKYDIKQLIGTELQGVTSGVTAVVVDASYSNEAESDTLFVKYTNSGNAADESTFRQGETLEVVNGVNTPLLVVGTDGSVLPTSITIVDPETGDSRSELSPAMGYASAVKIEEGIYFVNGFFVRNDEQLLIISKYYNRPSAKVGFNIVESIVSAEEDNSLYDNAKGYSNFSSPGANRLRLTLDLQKYGYTEITDKNFIQIVKIKSGVIEKKINKADYTLLEDTLARRTYDESGDYVVDDFSIDIREYYQKNNNIGFYNLDRNTNTVNGLSVGEAERKMVASVGPGKAYVRGYEIVNKETKFLEVEKSRDTIERDNITIKGKGLSEFKISNVYGSVPLNADGSDLTAYPNVYLYSTFNDGSIGLNGTENTQDYKQTLNRRGLEFSYTSEGVKFNNEDIAIKTIYLEQRDSNFTFTDITDSNFQTQLGTLWFRKTNDEVDSVRSIAWSLVRRPELDGSGVSDYLELTVYGRKDHLDIYFKEYNDNDTNNETLIFRTRNDALSVTGQEFGVVRDYNNTITPLIGIAKPKNFYFKDLPSGFNPNNDKVLSKGVNSYDGTFAFTYFNPIFFTRLTLDSPIAQDTFRAGKYIVGSKSGAYGVIEGSPSGYYSSGNELFIRTLYGNFVPGETISDEDSNVRRIAIENTISHFIVTRRASGYNSAVTKISIDGIEYDSSKIQIGIDNIGTIYKVSIANRNSLLQTYSVPPEVKAIVSSGTEPNPEVEIIAVLFKDTVLNYSPENIKSFYSVFGSGNSNRFTADAELNKEQYSIISQITSYTFSGTKGYKFLESSGFGDDASNYVKQGDLVQFTDSQGIVNRSIVQSTTRSEGSKKTRIYLDSCLHEDVLNSSVVRVRPRQSNTTSSTLIFPTGSRQVKSLIKDVSDSKFKYYFRRDFVTTGSSSGGNLTFAAQLPFGTQRFVRFSREHYIVTVLDKGNSTVVENGDIVYINDSYVNVNTSTDSTSGLTSGSVTITLPEDFFGDIDTNFPTLKLTATLEVSKAKPRLKTSIANKRIVITSGGDRVVPLRGYDYDTEDTEIFSYSDAYKLRYIYEGGANPPIVDSSGTLISGKDVTNRFTFDDGQRDTFYDVSRIVLKPGFDPPTGQLVVGFDYFDHSQGDFCTADSYLHEAGVGEQDIPSFNSSVFGNISLKNVIDFRPKVDSNAVISGFQDRSILTQSDFTSFTGPGGVPSSTPATDSNIEFTISFSETQYLDRIDGIFLTKKGEFIAKEGNSSLNPAKPETIDDSIPLYYIYVPSYTISSRDVKVIPVDNKRYTMRDIGKLEKRIERLEHYTTLSILEQQALNMQIKDEIGLDRFKSGFIVDNFETHKVGNLSSIDYRCSIDTQQSVLRPQVKEDSVSLKELYSNDDERSLYGYVYNNGIVTLPYTNLNLVGNQFATKTINPNPFVVIQYAGDGELYPQIDPWYDDSVQPIVVNDNTGLFSIFSAKSDTYEGFSSIYNNFIINWVGTDRTFYNIEPLTSIDSERSISTVEMALVSSSSNITPQNYELAQGVGKKTIGKKTVTNSVQLFARSQEVKYVIRRMKPKTQIFVFMEGKNIGRWSNPDIRFTGIAGNSPSAFGRSIITDENGNASGILIIPAGYPPIEGTSWTNDIETVAYDINSDELRFPSGVKTLRFTSSSVDADKNTVDTYAEVKYYATGILPENPSSIISTKPSYFKANEGVQLIDSNTDIEVKPNPLAQTFKVENYQGGVFATGVDLFFNKKSSNIPIRVYLTNVDLGKPAKNIVPGTECDLNPETKLKVYASGNLAVKSGELVNGSRSGASGPIQKVLDKNNVEITPLLDGRINLTNEQVYTFVLSNHNGVSFLQDEQISTEFLTTYNNQNSTDLTLRIAKDSGKISELSITSTGSKYESAILTIESPQLPGGSTATAVCKVSGGKIYDTELTLAGSGYTENPSVVINGTGSGASGAIVKAKIEINNPAVIMGVAVDDFDTFGVVDSITPTRFNFKHPVYLQNNSEYSLVIETDSTDYLLWSSKLGEADIATSITVTTQPALGSLYKSQNIDNWTEDLFEDVKFSLYRAEFDIRRKAELFLKNESLRYEKLQIDPIETSTRSNSTATSKLFKNNNSILKINHRDHGFEDSGKSYVFFNNTVDVGGITSSTLNTTLFEVMNSGIDTYNIQVPYRAGSSVLGGGNSVIASHNRKYEKLYAQVNYIQSEGTSINSFVKTTNIIPVDSNTQNYTSYSISDYEKTFLNEEHFFSNQKVIASDINTTLNNIDNSLTYKIELSSDVSYLSPVIDISSSSVKVSNNRIEHGTGKENRFGKRYQKLSFFPVYSFTITGNNANDVDTNQSVEGLSSKAKGEIIKYDTNTVWVRLTSINTFEANEELFFSSQSQSGGDFYNPKYFGGTDNNTIVAISNFGVTEIVPTFDVGSAIVAINPSNATIKYDNKISGKIIYWDSQFGELIVENDKQPINDDFTSQITVGSDYSRKSTIGEQSNDIFRVNDVVFKDNLASEDSQFIKVSSMEFESGVDYVSETSSKNSSAIAKYVTKEISLNSDGTGVDVRLTVNLKDVENVKVFYKTKNSSSQENFDDINWVAFNTNGNPDIDEIATATNSISGEFEEQKSYQELKYSASNLQNFSSFAVKVVMQTTDPAYSPKIQDIRAVASY